MDEKLTFPPFPSLPFPPSPLSLLLSFASFSSRIPLAHSLNSTPQEAVLQCFLGVRSQALVMKQKATESGMMGTKFRNNHKEHQRLSQGSLPTVCLRWSLQSHEVEPGTLVSKFKSNLGSPEANQEQQ